ncbi:MAG: chloride channel protein [Clostridiales bacterium]|nr:chloride channel protein [Clostridiales bacterium]
MNRLEKIRRFEKYILAIMKWVALSLLVGALGGLLGAAFYHTLISAAGLREEHSWLIFLLPIGGFAIVGLYKLFRLGSNRGTNEVIEAVLSGESVHPLIAPAIFISTAITQLFGGSAGREGATLQMGSSMASLLAEMMQLKHKDRTVLIMCGMSAVFAGLFGTPLTACLFIMEFESVGTIFSPALLPCYLAAFTASKVSFALGVHPETYVFDAIGLSFSSLWRIALLAVLISILGVAMCFLFHNAEQLAHRFFHSPWLRIGIGGVLILAMTLLVGDQRFNGAGMELAMSALDGSADWYSFALKLIFTAVTLAAGFKGGEIVPTFAIGATFGCAAGGLLGLDPGFAAALGIVGLFCCATNSPLASIVLSLEMFGGANLHIFALVCVLCFVLSGSSSLYDSQIFRFPKANHN